MPRVLILLIGEQPAPNLLPTQHLLPDTVVLVHTEKTNVIAQRLYDILTRKGFDVLQCKVEPYNLSAIQDNLQQFIKERFQGCEIIFNLTGGTKIMSLAGFLIALQLNVPFVYFQTKGSQSLLYYYQFTDQKSMQIQNQEVISDHISLDDYLRAQIGEYTYDQPRNKFEHQIYETLKDIPELEVFPSVKPQSLGALEIDFVIRLGNRVGVIEAKTKGAKSGIDQIQAVAEQRYLGTYVTKFLISGSSVDINNKNLAKAYNIEIIEVLSYTTNKSLSKEDREKIQERILSRLRAK